MAEPPLKVLIVDDHKLVRLGLKDLFETAPHARIVAEASTGSDAIRLARECRPDVVLLDVRLPDLSGTEACREIRSERPETKVIMLSSYSDQEAVVNSIVAGASGYLLKAGDTDELIRAVEVVGHGGSLIDPAIHTTVLSWMQSVGQSAQADPLAQLTESERRVLPLIAEGKTNRQIAEDLFLSEFTVKTHVSNILQKLHLARRAEAAAFIARLQQSGSA